MDYTGENAKGGASMKVKGALCIILSGVIFGLMPIAAKAIYANGGNSQLLTFLRYLFSLPLLWLLQRRETKAERLTGDQIRRLLLVASGYVVTPLLLFLSYNYIPSGLSTTLHFVYPVLVLVGCAALYRERILPRQALCCALCVAGVVCFYTPGGGISLFGVAVALLSGVFYAFYIICLAKCGLQAELTAFRLAFWLQAVGTLAAGVMCLFTGSLWVDMTPLGWGLCVLFSLVTLGGSLCFQVGTGLCGPQYASLLSTFEPLTSVVVGVAILHEALTLRSGVGIVCVLASVVLLTLGKNEAVEAA